jgi:hypothetical protein
MGRLNLWMWMVAAWDCKWWSWLGRVSLIEKSHLIGELHCDKYHFDVFCYCWCVLQPQGWLLGRKAMIVHFH